MDVGLGIAGLICVAMAAGHASIGIFWVLPSLDAERLPATSLGPASMTVSVVRVTWHVVTIFAAGVGGILLTLASDASAEVGTTALRWFAGMWFAAAVMAAWVVRGRIRHLLRLPVPVLWVIVGVLLWKASM